jgi:UDP-N-acetylglucosamine 2-epimerase (non-hydrolysing)
LDPSRRLILVTAHRRESFGAGVEQICAALAQIAGMREVQIVYPVHPNPNVSGTVREKLSGVANILLLEPLDYVAFVDLMARSYLLLTDSGGVQEEGPSLGKPVLVMRSVTERPEAVEAGTAVLTGHDTTTIVEEVAKLLENHAEYDRRSRIHNPYGDGQASQRIADRVQDFLD